MGGKRSADARGGPGARERGGVREGLPRVPEQSGRRDGPPGGRGSPPEPRVYKFYFSDVFYYFYYADTSVGGHIILAKCRFKQSIFLNAKGNSSIDVLSIEPRSH